MKIQVPSAGVLLALLLVINLPTSTVHGQGTAFAYQGRLSNNGAPVNGIYDLRFMIYNVATNGVPVAGPLTNSAVAVSNGLFTTTVDFGPGIFTGSNYWLGIGVRTNGGGSDFDTLAPRQAIMPVPYAICANTASNVSGAISVAQLPATVLIDGASGVNLSGTFAGDGGGLANLSATAIVGNIPQSNLGATNSYTPTIGDGGNNFNTSVAQGYSTRIGNLVFVEIWLVWTNRGSAYNGNSVQISLPVAVGSPRAVFAIGYASGIDFANVSGDQQLVTTASQGSSSLQLWSLVPYAGATGLTVINCADNGQIQLSGFYRVQ
jgi:hypothetical protein